MKYRANGAVGAILDEYERALNELKSVIKDISNDELAMIADSKTTDPDCRSIQTVLSHVVRSGYTYAIMVRKKLGEQIDFKERVIHSSTRAYAEDLDNMFSFNERLFIDHPSLHMETFQGDNSIPSNWDTNYDLEQLYEHAIVHILRHRRQIKRFIINIRKNSLMRIPTKRSKNTQHFLNPKLSQSRK